MITLFLGVIWGATAQTAVVAAEKYFKAEGGKGKYKEEIAWINWDLNGDKQAGDVLSGGVSTQFIVPNSGIQYTLNVKDVVIKKNKNGVYVLPDPTNAKQVANFKSKFTSANYNSWIGNSFMRYYNWTTDNGGGVGLGNNPATPTANNNNQNNDYANRPISLSIARSFEVSFVVEITAKIKDASGNYTIDLKPEEFGVVLAGTEEAGFDTKEYYSLGTNTAEFPNSVIGPLEYMEIKKEGAVYPAWSADYTNTQFGFTITKSQDGDYKTLTYRGVDKDHKGDVICISTGTRKVKVKLNSNGAQHVAFGVLDLKDCGDAPDTYEEAGKTPASHLYNVKVKDFTSSNVTITGAPDSAGNLNTLNRVDKPELGLGTLIDAEIDKTASADADADDKKSVITPKQVDEDAIPKGGQWIKTCSIPVHVVNKNATRTGWLYAWFDVNNNGKFDVDEAFDARPVPPNTDDDFEYNF